MSEWIWIGHTQAGRELRLFGEEGTVAGADLDGERIQLERISFRGGRELGDGYLVKSDAGTFTAISEGSDPKLHSILLRKFVDAAPDGGWQLQFDSGREIDGEHRFAFEVSSDWRTATLEIYLSESVARVWLERGGGRTLQEMAQQELANKIRRADWPAIQQMADSGPSEILFAAHAPDRY